MSKKPKTKCQEKDKNGAGCRYYEPCRVHGENSRITHNKEILLTSLEKFHGIVTDACNYADISRKTFYNYLADDSEFAAAVKDISETSIDFVEGKLFSLIEGVKIQTDEDIYTDKPCKTAIIFYLKTKGKHRGYVERIEQTGKDGEPIQVETGAILILPDNGRDPVK